MYNTASIESQTQMLIAEAVAELRQCDYGDTSMVKICRGGR